MIDKSKVFLIASGAYANAELTSDFGLIPSAFLPIGHKRLIELQVEKIKDFKITKIITLPENYKLLKRDEDLLNKNNILIHRTNSNLNLAQSILSFLSFYEINNTLEELFILHGDTSFESIDLKSDLLYYGFTDTFYKWGHLEDIIGEDIIHRVSKQESFNQPVISGYFSFSKPSLFKEMLNKYNSFENSLKNYHQKVNLKPILKSSWLDFGHSNLYYKSKIELNVARNFNQVIAKNNYIIKTSDNFNKIESEYKWFKQLPEKLLIFTPTVWDFNNTNNKASYKVEFIGAPTLQEKWVFGNLPDFVYYNIINQIFLFLNKTKKIIFEEYDNDSAVSLLKELYIKKTKERVKIFSKQTGFNMLKPVFINNKQYPPLKEFVNKIITLIDEELANEQKLTLMHGDLCFSNILSDTRSNNIKFIDPRGSLDNKFDSENKIIGDYKYDIAKLGHSLIGNYDHIVTGFFNLKIDKHKEQSFAFSLQHSDRDFLKDFFFKKVSEIGVSPEFIKTSIVNLFISMLPLHNEDKNRQIALLLNAYKIFYK